MPHYALRYALRCAVLDESCSRTSCRSLSVAWRAEALHGCGWHACEAKLLLGGTTAPACTGIVSGQNRSRRERRPRRAPTTVWARRAMSMGPVQQCGGWRRDTPVETVRAATVVRCGRRTTRRFCRKRLTRFDTMFRFSEARDRICLPTMAHARTEARRGEARRGEARRGDGPPMSSSIMFLIGAGACTNVGGGGVCRSADGNATGSHGQSVWVGA